MPRHRSVATLATVLTAVLAAHAIFAADVPLSTVEEPPQFSQDCAVCHSSDASGTDRAPALKDSRSLRGRSQADIAAIIRDGRGNMPSFSSLPRDQIDALAHFIRSLNSDAFDVKPAGDVAAGERIFYGSGRCGECHTAQGREAIDGPDLSNVAHLMTVSGLVQSILQPDARRVPNWAMVTVTLRNGATVRGFARNQTEHSLDLQTSDGRLQLLLDDEYTRVVRDQRSSMPAFAGSAQEQRDLVAFLSTLGGVPLGPDPAAAQTPLSREAIDAVAQPKPGEWPTYAGNVDGNRYSTLKLINTQNVAALRPAWTYSIPYFGLEMTPLVIDGVMYVTGPNQVYALDGRTGSEIWKYSRPRSVASAISGDAAKGANRGVAVLGNHVFFITDNAHLICLQKLTGALLWEVPLAEQPGRYGGTSAPLIAGDLVIAGVSGGDEGIRGFIAAFKATTGERVWRLWTVPAAGDPQAQSWQGDPKPQGGATWTTASYDPASGVLYAGIGNPYPDTDGDNRGGDNLYTDSDLALDAKSGKILWHFQFTPHDVHDWDANQPIALVNAPWHGRERKLLLHANRNGFFYVLDRTDGQLLVAKPFVKLLTWASGIDAAGRPILLPANETTTVGVKTCPAVRGATNWYSTAYNPSTHLYYVMTVEDCTIYHKAQDGGYQWITDYAKPSMKVLRAISIESGAIAWEVPLVGSPENNYSGVLSTAGGLVFYGETSGGFAAVDANNGKSLWHFQLNQPWKASPMTYVIDGRQYIAIASGANIVSFALAAK